MFIFPGKKDFNWCFYPSKSSDENLGENYTLIQFGGKRNSETQISPKTGNFHIILPAPACRNVVIGENQNCEKIIGKDDNRKFMKYSSKSEINIP